MKLKISLAHLNDNGTIAEIEDSDDNSFTVAQDYRDRKGVRTCLAAAKALRAAADKFDALAIEADMFKSTTQRRINARKKTPV